MAAPTVQNPIGAKSSPANVEIDFDITSVFSDVVTTINVLRFKSSKNMSGTIPQWPSGPTTNSDKVSLVYTADLPVATGSKHLLTATTPSNCRIMISSTNQLRFYYRSASTGTETAVNGPNVQVGTTYNISVEPTATGAKMTVNGTDYANGGNVPPDLSLWKINTIGGTAGGNPSVDGIMKNIVMIGSDQRSYALNDGPVSGITSWNETIANQDATPLVGITAGDWETVNG
jgi:hypothetical protein